MNFKIATTTILILGIGFTGMNSIKKKKATSENSEVIFQAEIDKRVEELLAKMTLEEKVGQMIQITLDVVGKGDNRYSSYEPFALDPAKLKNALVDYKIGSILNTANTIPRTPQIWYSIVQQIQDVSLKQTRLKIPNIYGVDAIHGATYSEGATMIPQEIAQAASWNRELVREGAEICAYETRACCIPWNFSPVLDLGSDPRSPRLWETLGEDPYLGSEMAKQIIDGYEGQNNDIDNAVHLASCMKHFLGYQVPLSGKDRTPSYIPDQALYEYHVPAFKAAIEAGSKTIMINSAIINGMPVHASHKLLTKLLKEELGFQGFVVTDWQDIENIFTRDHMASSHKEAIMMCINAGVDMSMVPYSYERFYNELIALVKEGKVKQERVDDAVRRILKVKFSLGLFEKPLTHYKDYPKFGSKEFERTSYNLAAEAITLLRNNNNILPLSKNRKVLITGPNANSMRTLNGGWSYSWQGEKTEKYTAKYNTIVEAITNKIGAGNVNFIPGVTYKMEGKYFEEYADKMDEAIAAAKNADVIILCLGENSYAEKPGGLHDLYLSDLQTQLAQKLTATGKPIILVLNEGRPRLISKFEQGIPAIIQVYLPSNFGGDALADILFGDVNPSGKLPYTYPRFPNALMPYTHTYSEEVKRWEGVTDYEADYNPQFEFGHGLSYTTFKYSNLKVDKESISKTQQLSISVDVSNTGKTAGKETIQMYISDLYASVIVPDIKRLRGFEKILLNAGETKTINFTIKPSDLAYSGHHGEKIVEAGDFKIQIADQEKQFRLTE
jgi:beta-glucosidase